MIVAFDLDGTLLDSHNLILHTMKFTIRHFNNNKKVSLEEVDFGKSIVELLGSHVESSKINAAVSFYREHIMVCDHVDCHVFDGTISTLEFLCEVTQSLVVITNKQTNVALHFLRKYSLDKFFDGVFGTDKGRPKPSSDLLHLANPRRISPFYFVGDQEQDIMASINYGCTSILFNPDGKNQKKATFIKPNYLVNSMPQLQRLFQSFLLEGVDL